MRVTIGSISEFAAAGAITTREWEALARFAAIAELRLGALLGQSDFGRCPGVIQPLVVGDFASDEIRRMLSAEGLSPADWFISITPKLPAAAPIPAQIEEWTLTLRLYNEISRAKRMALSAIPSSEEHKPTLSEQFGKKD